MKSATKGDGGDSEAKKKASAAASTPTATSAGTGSATTPTAVVDLNDDDKISDLSNRSTRRSPCRAISIKT